MSNPTRLPNQAATFLRQTAMLLLLLPLLGVSALAATIRGTVTDAETGDALPGANVLLEGTSLGATTDISGRYAIDGVQPGSYNVVASFVGFQRVTLRVTVNTAGQTVVADFRLREISEALQALEVFASRAIDRRTPVAYSDVEKVQIQRQLGSRDIPLVLNTTPSVYATAGGGGAGDSRITVRGFNQRNVAVMVNGVPINDMENGWVYWSNWDGLADATSSIQLQRGLSAVNLATPSIGGTLNILTDPTTRSAGGSVKQEVGNDGFLKTTLNATTGLIDNKYALSVGGVRKVGDGVIDGTWTDAWAYYVAASYAINSRNRIDLYALGAPQRHGQNSFRQNIAAYGHEFAKSLEGFEQGALDKYAEGTKNCQAYWGDNSAVCDARRYNQNWGPVSPSYTGQQAVEDKTFDRHNPNFINERENFYHKPIANLNWYFQATDQLLISTVLYYSGGTGGGTGTIGSILYRNPGPGLPSRVVDWDANIARNAAGETGSRGILRNSRNNQWTVGAIAKAKLEVSEALNVEFGIDWRTAKIEHYREVRDLLGGSFYTCNSANRCGVSDFWTGNENQRKLGDKIDYDFDNTVDWLGGFLQGEYVSGPVTLYGMGGLSTIKYTYENFFRKVADGGTLKAETDNIWGSQIKGGGLYNISDEVGVFANVGYVSKVPIFDYVIDDVGGYVNPDPKNETFMSAEAGLQFRFLNNALAAKLNVYSTTWKDRTLIRNVILGDGTEGLVNILGLDARHQGVELELAYQPIREVRFDGGASFGNWKYLDDVSGTYRPDDRTQDLETFNFYVKDLKVGDAPQTQFAYGLSLFPIRGLFLQAVGMTYGQNYADFDPFGRTKSDDRKQSWMAPGYTLVNLHASYALPLSNFPVGIELFGHVFNLLDEIYVQDALDNSSFNGFDRDHDADDAEVYLGIPRSFNMGVRIRF